MKEVIEKFLNNYVTAKLGTFAGHPFGTFMRSDFPEALYATGIVDRERYLITGSVGQGNWAMVPWVCVFDKSITTSATKGIYIVYLLSKDGKSLYLTFNQGCTEISNTHSKKETIALLRSRAAEITRKIDGQGFLTDENINLGEGLTTLGQFYQKGTIFYKEYKQGAVPAENELQDDLKKMMTIYQAYKNSLHSHSVGKFDSWEILNDTVAVKHCDKSFFEHRGSGVPKDISWFFNADSLENGASRSIQLIWDDKVYAGRVQRELADTNRIRVFWNMELGKQLEPYAAIANCTLKFIRQDDENYRIFFEGGETEMENTTKANIDAIKNFIASRGFAYEGNLIDNFYLSLKSKPFVILAGTSGTGKTRLVKLFAEAIGAEYKLVSVRPDWSDGSDLFGHYDLNGKFIDGPVCKCFEMAYENPDIPVFLCLDEMNLARVEYYLSDFLSVIESREKLENGKVITTPIAQFEKGIPDNLYIVGTVNMDETTFPFSKKVLDRANTIEFSYVDLTPDFDVPEQPPKGVTLPSSFLRTEYLVLVRDCVVEQEYVREICAELQQINEILKKADAHVGYRVRDEIVFYMLNNKAGGELLTHEEAFDNEIMQKILPRIQGSSVSVRDMLCELFKICAGDYNQKTGDTDSEKMRKLLSDKSITCKYRKSAKKLELMVRRFEEDGFTSYWL